MKSCSVCGSAFEIFSEDRELYRQYDFPEPEECPTCRHQARCTYRNERTLYKRKCDLCGTDMITIFSGDRPFPVYCQQCFWSDRWDPLRFGRDFDFSRPFFDQFLELQNKVPRIALNNIQHENSEYCNQSIGNKNSYLLFGSDENEDCMYGVWINRCKDTYNSNNLADCQRCYELIDSENCHECIASQDLRNCRNCAFSFDLIGCSDCFGCSGLRNKQYYFCNEPHTKAEYRAKLQHINLGSAQAFAAWQQKFPKICQHTPHKYAHILQTEDCTGDYISQSKNCFASFDVFGAEDCRYAYNLVHQQFRNFDVSYVTVAQNLYQVTSGIGQDLFFSTVAINSLDVWYSDICFFSQHIFGSVGLRHQQHCIFNRKYTAQEFPVLREKIIAHMKQTGEWGRFFPVQNSLYAYNETVAQDFFPRSKEEVLTRGWRWKEKDKHEYIPQKYSIPDHIADASEEILDEILACTTCGKNYRILAPELAFYKNLEVPVPRKCPDCRYLVRMKLRNPRTLWKRNCMQCGVELETTYAPERPEKIFCEGCYLQAVG